MQVKFDNNRTNDVDYEELFNKIRYFDLLGMVSEELLKITEYKTIPVSVELLYQEQADYVIWVSEIATKKHGEDVQLEFNGEVIKVAVQFIRQNNRWSLLDQVRQLHFLESANSIYLMAIGKENSLLAENIAALFEFESEFTTQWKQCLKHCKEVNERTLICLVKPRIELIDNERYITSDKIDIVNLSTSHRDYAPIVITYVEPTFTKDVITKRTTNPVQSRIKGGNPTSPKTYRVQKKHLDVLNMSKGRKLAENK